MSWSDNRPQSPAAWIMFAYVAVVFAVFFTAAAWKLTHLPHPHPFPNISDAALCRDGGGYGCR